MMKEAVRIIGKTVRRYGKKDPWMLPAVLARNFFQAVRPFIMIVLSSLLLDMLVSGETLEKMLRTVCGGVVFQFFFQLIDWYIERVRSEKWLQTWMIQEEMMAEQNLHMEYAFLEDSQVQYLKRRLDDYQGMNGSLYGGLFDSLEQLASACSTILIAAVLIVPLLQAGGIWSGILLLVMGGLIWLQNRETRLFDRKINDAMKKWFAVNRVGSYYRQVLFKDYEHGKDMRVFGQKKLVERELSSLMQALGELEKTRRKLQVRYGGTAGCVAMLFRSLLYLFIGLLAYVGLVSAGGMVRYVNGISQFMNSFSSLAAAISRLRQALPYMKDNETLLTMEKKDTGNLPLEAGDDGAFTLEFRNVTFRYPNREKDALREVNVKIHPGERLAVVGRNGSGKSTFIKLLCRLYDPDEGEILLNGNPVRQYEEREYLQFLSVVFQDYHIFGFTIAENVAGGQQVDEKRVREAMEKAGLERLLSRLPEGLNTYVSKNFSPAGLETSGGENQKLAIARAIYRGAPLVVMDEPTAALDPVAEHEVYSGFDRLIDTKTAVYVSHRLASCRFCDRILVFDEGRVVQEGTHETLLQEEGVYRELWQAQAVYYQPDRPEESSRVCF